MSKSKTEYVTIPLEEYKELLLKEKPSNNSGANFERVIEMIEKNIEYTKSDYYTSYLGDNMGIKNSDKIIREIVMMIKYNDFERYMEIWNKVQTNHRKEEEMKMKMEQMNKAKEIRKKNNDE